MTWLAAANASSVEKRMLPEAEERTWLRPRHPRNGRNAATQILKRCGYCTRRNDDGIKVAFQGSGIIDAGVHLDSNRVVSDFPDEVIDDTQQVGAVGDRGCNQELASGTVMSLT